MTKIIRQTQKIFASDTMTNGQFGSAKLGTKLLTNDIETLQALSAYEGGWNDALITPQSLPTYEEEQALHYINTYQLSYLLQEGIPEYDSATIYYTGSLCMSGGIIYVSKTDANTGNALTSSTYWRIALNTGGRTVVIATSITNTDALIRSDTTSGALTHTLPTIASSHGQIITVKDVGTGGFATTVQANGAELIDGVTIYGTVLNQYDTLKMYNNGTTWDVI